ncbi:MAG TPA: UDP-N-acetylmuramoyl-L-alanine--D-glutamate ligase [Gammaproteobacteria bacterium]
MQRQATNKGYSVVVGLGKTGLSCARFLAAHGVRFVIADSRTNPPGAEEMRRLFPAEALHLGPFDAALLRSAAQIVLSPGVAPQEPVIAAARQAGVPVLGDIELFARHVNAPVVAITGSNGKSTVTTLVGEMAKAAGRKVRVGGNLGTPALDLLLDGEAPDLYVLELSSFQLEVTESLNARAATVLNISEDHLDRHGTVAAYAAIKQRVFRGDGVMVLNRDDPLVVAMAEPDRRVVGFSLQPATCNDDYGLQQQGDDTWLAKGRQRLINTRELRIAGRHNWANAMASLALGEAVGLPMPAMIEVLRKFPGLPHRCQWIAEHNGVNWYEDSKGTNVGATLAALAGMPGNKVVLIAGGQGKGQDFMPLRPVVNERARAVVLIGEDAPLIATALGDGVPLLNAASMDEAVMRAAAAAQPGDVVLLSPACASFDMFSNYVARGEAFTAAVQARARS